MVKYGTVSSPAVTAKFEDLFDEGYDETLWYTKKVYTQNDDELPFKYRYAFRAFEVEDGKFVTELCLAIEPESLCKEKQDELLATTGLEDASQITIEDAIDCLFCASIPFASETANDAESLEALKDACATALPAYDMMRGFYIDRPMNRVGTTGWDLIEEAKGLIKDALRGSIERLRA